MDEIRRKKKGIENYKIKQVFVFTVIFQEKYLLEQQRLHGFTCVIEVANKEMRKAPFQKSGKGFVKMKKSNECGALINSDIRNVTISLEKVVR